MRSAGVTVLVGMALTAGQGQAATVFATSGATPAEIQSTVDDFRAALGDLNPFLPESFAGGRREINWDGVPDAISDPNLFPGATFNGAAPGTARGLVSIPTGASTGLSVSASLASGVPIEFGEDEEYTPFSPEKLFEPVGGSTLDNLLFDPSDQTTPATTTGFGVVFTGLPSEVAPTMTFFGRGGGILAQESVAITSDAGLAFLGVLFDDPDIARVAIDVGDEAVMDDFLYGEPAPIPLPAGLPLLAAGLAGLVGIRRLRGRTR